MYRIFYLFLYMSRAVNPYHHYYIRQFEPSLWQSPGKIYMSYSVKVIADGSVYFKLEFPRSAPVYHLRCTDWCIVPGWCIFYDTRDMGVFVCRCIEMKKRGVRNTKIGYIWKVIIVIIIIMGPKPVGAERVLSNVIIWLLTIRQLHKPCTKIKQVIQNAVTMYLF